MAPVSALSSADRRLANRGRHCIVTAMFKDVRNIVILTGAGLSAESGIPTFRTKGAVSYWETVDSAGVPVLHRVEDICTPQALARDPMLVHDFYDARRASLTQVQPNAGHAALAALDRAWDGGLLIVTQNVDDLHERAGTGRLLHMHGELRSALCAACGKAGPWDGPLPPGEQCNDCNRPALRPDIVFFGEMPYHMEAIDAALRDADLFVSIGTSGAVYPAAGFVQTARHAGALTVELNLEPSAGSSWFEDARLGPATRLVPELVAELLA